jgi:hypothetical protein
MSTSENANSLQRAETTIKQLRNLRALAARLNGTAKTDLKMFLQHNGVTYRRLPANDPDRVSVTTTCTVQMALASNDLLKDVYPNNTTADSVGKLLQPMLDAEWTSSGLREGNPFTPILILRNAGFLATSVESSAPKFLALEKRRGRGAVVTLREVIVNLAGKAVPECFRLDETLRENPALGYWLIDAIDRLKLSPDPALPERFWISMADWCSREYTRQYTLVASRHDIMMDPVALALAACLSERLRRIANKPDFPHGDEVKAVLPTAVELLHGLDLLLPLQQHSGIWDKFFPMFYYREDEKPGARRADPVLHRGGPTIVLLLNSWNQF